MAIKKNLTTKYTSSTHRKSRDNKRPDLPLSRTLKGTPVSERQGGASRLANNVTRNETERVRQVEGMGLKDNPRSYACRYSRSTGIKKFMTLETVTFASVIVFIGMVFFYLFYPFEPVRLLTDPIPVVEHKIKAGETVSLLIHFDKKLDIVPQIKYYLVDGFVLELSQSSVSRGVGENTVVREILIPESSTKGMRKIRIQLEYKINILRTVYYSWDSDEFEVI